MRSYVLRCSPLVLGQRTVLSYEFLVQFISHNSILPTFLHSVGLCPYLQGTLNSEFFLSFYQMSVLLCLSFRKDANLAEFLVAQFASLFGAEDEESFEVFAQG